MGEGKELVVVRRHWRCCVWRTLANLLGRVSRAQGWIDVAKSVVELVSVPRDAGDGEAETSGLYCEQYGEERTMPAGRWLECAARWWCWRRKSSGRPFCWQRQALMRMAARARFGGGSPSAAQLSWMPLVGGGRRRSSSCERQQQRGGGCCSRPRWLGWQRKCTEQ